MLSKEGGPGSDHLGGEAVHHPALPRQSDQEPEIQHNHLPPAPIMEPIQVLFKLLLSRDGLQSVHPPAEDWLPLHLLGAPGLRAVSDHHQGGH